MSAISNCDSAVVDITDVFADAQKVPVEAVIIGDKVFDIFGQTYDIVDLKASQVRKDGLFWIHIKRSDNPGVWECIGEGGGSDYRPTITIIPSLGARR